MSLPPPLPAPPMPNVPPAPPAFEEVPVTTARPATPVVIGILFILGALAEFGGLHGSLGKESLVQHINCVDSTVFGLGQLIVGIGLLHYRRWAPNAAITALILRYVTHLPLSYYLMLDEPAVAGVSSTILQIVYIGISVILLVYFVVLIVFLSLRKTRAACTN